MKDFRIWLLNESTVVQLLKQLKNPYVDSLTEIIKKHIKTYAWTNQIPDNKLMVFVKWVLFPLFFNANKQDPDYLDMLQSMKGNEKYAGVHLPPKMDMLAKRAVTKVLQHNQDYIAFLFQNNQQNKFNNPGYTPELLAQDTEQWHIQLAAKKRQPAAEGRPVLKVGEYTWVSLDKGYCDEEAEAMGHCGNQGAREGDNILSLRDARNIAHLTFIVNDEELGESKGVGNSKPSKAYHPQIVALLLSPYINFIKGGGYKPENNFKFEDLDPQLQQKVLLVKPNINKLFQHILSRHPDPVSFTKQLYNMYGQKFEIDMAKQIAVVHREEELSKIINWLNENTKSKVEGEHYVDFESNMDDNYEVSRDECIDNFNHAADEKNTHKVEQIIAKICAEEAGEDEDCDLEWALNNNDELENVLQWAVQEAYRMGAETEAYEAITKDLASGDDNGFFVENSDKGYELKIDFKHLEALYSQMNDESFENLIEFKYTAPYNGFSGFHKEGYNERLADLLHEHFDEFLKAPPPETPQVDGFQQKELF